MNFHFLDCTLLLNGLIWKYKTQVYLRNKTSFYVKTPVDYYVSTTLSNNKNDKIVVF